MLSNNSSDSDSSRSSSGSGSSDGDDGDIGVDGSDIDSEKDDDMIVEKGNDNLNKDDDNNSNDIHKNLNVDEINDKLNDIHSMNLLGDHIIHDNRWINLASIIMLEYSQDMIDYNNKLIIQNSRSNSNEHDSYNTCDGINCSSSSSSSSSSNDDNKTKDYISIHSSLRSIITFIQEYFKSASIDSTILHQDIESTTTSSTPPSTTSSSSTHNSSSTSSISSISVVVSEQVLKAYDIINGVDKDIFEDLLEIFSSTVNIIKKSNNF